MRKKVDPNRLRWTIRKNGKVLEADGQQRVGDSALDLQDQDRIVVELLALSPWGAPSRGPRPGAGGGGDAADAAGDASAEEDPDFFELKRANNPLPPLRGLPGSASATRDPDQEIGVVGPTTFRFMREVECSYGVNHYMLKQPKISPRMRAILFDWMVEV